MKCCECKKEVEYLCPEIIAAYGQMCQQCFNKAILEMICDLRFKPLHCDTISQESIDKLEADGHTVKIDEYPMQELSRHIITKRLKQIRRRLEYEINESLEFFTKKTKKT